MSRLAASLETVARVLGQSERRWALVGALAVSARTEPRFTRDVDVAVAVVDDDDANRVVSQFRSVGYLLFALVEEARGRLATARLAAPQTGDSAGVILDLLFASSGVEQEIIEAAESLEIVPGLRVAVARAGDLLALKVLSRAEKRPQDAADIQALLRVLTEDDRSRALRLAGMIAERGFARGKELSREVKALIG